MNIRITSIIHGIFFLLTATFAHSNDTLKSGTVSFVNDDRLYVEIADTEDLRAFGLMQRPSLNENTGMLFVYPDEEIRGVWMKNTLLALDVLFLSESGLIVSMLRNLQPCKQTPCSIYSSQQKARYMLEVNAGFIDKHNIKIGQDVMLDYKHDTP